MGETPMPRESLRSARAAGKPYGWRTMSQPPNIPFAAVAQPMLTPEQMRDLHNGRVRMKKIRRAMVVAKFDGWSLAVFAAISLLAGYSSASGIFIGLGLGTAAFVELRAVRRLETLESRAAAVLGWNQIGLAGVLIAYALWNILRPPPLPPELLAQKKAYAELGVDVNDLVGGLTSIVYYGLIALTMLCQVPLGLFYFRRRKLVEDYVAQTPAWVVQMQAQGFGV